MKKVALLIVITAVLQQAWAQNRNTQDSVYWIQIAVDSCVVHAAVATPKGAGPFPAIIILHGTHGFAEECIRLARRMSEHGIVGIAACWFAGWRGNGTRFITPIEFNDAPPLIDVPGLDRFRLARKIIDSLVRKVNTLSKVREGYVTLFGHSRGAGAALDYVLTHPGNVRAVILRNS